MFLRLSSPFFGLLLFHTIIEFGFLSYMKNYTRTLIGIFLNVYISLGIMDIFKILNILIHELGTSFYLFRSFIFSMMLYHFVLKDAVHFL